MQCDNLEVTKKVIEVLDKIDPRLTDHLEVIEVDKRQSVNENEILFVRIVMVYGETCDELAIFATHTGTSVVFSNLWWRTDAATGQELDAEVRADMFETDKVLTDVIGEMISERFNDVEM